MAARRLAVASVAVGYSDRWRQRTWSWRKSSFDAFKRGDADAYVASFSPDVEWKMSAFVTGRGDYKGREGVREFLAEVSGSRA